MKHLNYLIEHFEFAKKLGMTGEEAVEHIYAELIDLGYTASDLKQSVDTTEDILLIDLKFEFSSYDLLEDLAWNLAVTALFDTEVEIDLEAVEYSECDGCNGCDDAELADVQYMMIQQDIDLVNGEVDMSVLPLLFDTLSDIEDFIIGEADNTEDFYSAIDSTRLIKTMDITATEDAYDTFMKAGTDGIAVAEAIPVGAMAVTMIFHEDTVLEAIPYIEMYSIFEVTNYNIEV